MEEKYFINVVFCDAAAIATASPNTFIDEQTAIKMWKFLGVDSYSHFIVDLLDRI